MFIYVGFGGSGLDDGEDDVGKGLYVDVLYLFIFVLFVGSWCFFILDKFILFFILGVFFEYWFG